MTPDPSVLTSLTHELVVSGTEGIFAFDHDLRCIVWNPAMVRLSANDDAIGKGVVELCPFIRHHGGEAMLREVLGGATIELKSAAFSFVSCGREGFCDVRLAPMRSRSGTVAGAVVIVRDITDARRGEQTLRETESRFQNMADASPVLLWMAGTDSMCTFFNQTWLDFTGRTLEQELGVGWAEGVHFEDLQGCIDTYMRAFSARMPLEMEYRLRRADGQYRWILDSGRPRHLPDGSFAGYIGSCVDITERKVAEVEMRRAVSVRDEFLAIASHELRTPLTTLRLQIDSLSRVLERRPIEALESGRIAQGADAVRTQTVRLTTLVDTLLDVSRISEGRLDLARESVDLSALVREIVERTKRDAVEAGCTVQVHGAASVVGQWDRMRVDQVVTNLLSNALKYGARKPVDIEVRDDAGLARVVVVDRGIGVGPENHARIFDRYERAASSRHHGGFGLGLWISREIVEAHGGRISVASDVGAGATFTVALPRVGS